jgi:hypothetical protein
MEKKLKIKKKFKKVIVNVKHKKCMGYRVLWFLVCGSTTHQHTTHPHSPLPDR